MICRNNNAIAQLTELVPPYLFSKYYQLEPNVFSLPTARRVVSFRSPLVNRNDQTMDWPKMYYEGKVNDANTMMM